tara:strand:+ start:1060 stop:1494 length:435 start_codon:yes stop_codon:yes gene_type:complete
MNQELKDWFFEQLKDCEDGKLDGPQKKMFLDTVEQGKHIPEFQEIYAKYREWKKKAYDDWSKSVMKHIREMKECEEKYPTDYSFMDCEECKDINGTGDGGPPMTYASDRCLKHEQCPTKEMYAQIDIQDRSSVKKLIEYIAKLY